MIKLRWLPCRRVVACIASLCKPLRNVVGIRSALEIFEVARNASVRGQIEIVVGMAVGTSSRRHRMHASQREIDAIMIESCRRPSRRRVTRVARCRKIQRHVAGIRGALEIFHVATGARRISQRVVVVHMAIRACARWHRVQSGEREAGAVVIEGRIGPVRSAMALFAGLWEIRGDVVRIGGSLVVLEVTGNTGCAGQAVVVVDVAISAGAWRHCVHSRQHKAGSGVIELTVGPLHGVMALLAGRRESRVGHRSGGVVVVGLVATDAGCNRDVVVVVDVTIGALARRHRMRTG